MVFATMLRVKSLNKEEKAMKKNYINPSVQVAQYASMSLMEAASPATDMNIVDIPSDQW